MYYSDDIIEEVRLKNDIVDVISGYVKLQKKGSSYFGLCPFHNEKSPSFSVSPHKQMYYCFGCGEGGNVFTFIMQYENYTFSEALKYLADRAGVTLPEIKYSKEAKQQADLKTQLLEIYKTAAKYFYHQLKSEKGSAAYHYLRGRELTDETITKFGLGYSCKYSDDLYKYMKSKGYKDDILKESGLFTYEDRGVYDKFWNRVMFPIMDVNNRVIGFGGRVMGDGKPKYLNSPETRLFDKSRNLYGLNVARTSRKNYILICEGYMDVIALHQAGFNNAVAALGTSFTSGHASLIKRYAEEVVLTFDSDAAGIKAAFRAIPILREAGLSIKVLNMSPYKDPDEFIKALGKEEYEKRIKSADNFFLFQVGVIINDYNLNDPDGKTKFYSKVADMLLKFSDEVERANYLEAVAGRFAIPKKSLDSMVKRKALSYDGKRDYERPKSLEIKKNTKESGIIQAQKIILTWLTDDPSLYKKISGIISSADFTDSFYQRAAEMLFDQLESGDINPARIISGFECEEDQKTAAGLFNAQLDEKLSEAERERAINDAVYKIKKNSLDNAAASSTDIAQMQNIIKEQIKLQKMHIRLD